MATKWPFSILCSLLMVPLLLTGYARADSLPLRTAQADSDLPINRLKCGVAKSEESEVASYKGSDVMSRFAMTEVALRCGGITVTSDGRSAVALLPDSAFSQTLEEYPTFLIYMPFLSPKEGIFSLSQSPNSYPYYQAIVKLTGQRSIISFKLPPSVPNLTVGRKYYWQFRFKVADAEEDNYEQRLIIRGQLQRVQPSAELQKALDKATATDRPGIYAQNGIWLDAFSSSAQIRTRDRGLSWTNLLQQVNLRYLASEPIKEVVIRPSK